MYPSICSLSFVVTFSNKYTIFDNPTNHSNAKLPIEMLVFGFPFLKLNITNMAGATYKFYQSFFRLHMHGSSAHKTVNHKVEPRSEN